MRRTVAVALACALALSSSSCQSGGKKPPPSNLGRVIGCTMKVDGQWGLWLVYLESGDQKRLAWTNDPGAAWSPDGYWVAWTDGTALRVTRLDGQEDHPVPGGAGWAPAWSPDGKQLAYSTMNSIQSRDVEGGHTKIWTVAETGCEHPTWSPDGTRLAATDSKGNLVVTDGTNEKVFPLNGARHPEWSPDGKRILLDAPDGAIRAFMVETGEVVPVGNARGADPSWLKDGSGFLTVWKGAGDDVPSVYVWDAAGVLGKKMTSRDEVRDAAPNW